ncbi:MAG: hypothetical protein JWO61_27 [Candidatus Saccharibacteria bacterium]|nr:hypothetical protein [Candidatus Saccharibacteria bacterium]
MNQVNLHDLLVEWLKKRNRWIRAGNNDLPRFLSIQLACGQRRVSELVQILRDAAGELHVEQDCGRIKMVGLQSWLTNEAIATTEIPSGQDDVWLLVGQLLGRTAELERDLLRAEADREVALELALAAELTPSSALTMETVDDRSKSERERGLETELAQTKRRLANTTAALETSRSSFQQIIREKLDAHDRLRIMTRRVRTLETQVEELAPFAEMIRQVTVIRL